MKSQNLKSKNVEPKIWIKNKLMSISSNISLEYLKVNRLLF